jgi:glycosyltransferase involved in cell wall biosynthesis
VLGGESPVWFLDEVGDEELRALYSAAEALLFPSLEEGFGWPIVEAQACGCPVITTHKAPMTEVGGEGPLYLEEAEVSGSDAGGLQRGSERISALLGEPDGVRERRRAAGFANVRRFSAEKMLREYVALYEAAVTERRSALN